MNWKIIIGISLTGVLMGVGLVAGWIGGLEGEAWFLISIPCGVVIAKNVKTRRFLHGFLAGAIAGIIGAAIEVVFMPTYLANNPETARMFAETLGEFSPRMLMLILVPFVGLISGLVLGVISVLIARLLARPDRSAGSSKT